MTLRAAAAVLSALRSARQASPAEAAPDETLVRSIEQILYQQSIECPSCGLVLTVNKEESQPALDSLKKLDDALKEASENQ